MIWFESVIPIRNHANPNLFRDADIPEQLNIWDEIFLKPSNSTSVVYSLVI